MRSRRPSPGGSDEIVISIGPDGRLYLHDLDPELARVALAINPTDAVMQKRLQVARARNATGSRKG